MKFAPGPRLGQSGAIGGGRGISAGCKPETVCMFGHGGGGGKIAPGGGIIGGSNE